MSGIKEKIRSKFPKIIFDEPLKKHCTYQIGGPADFFYELEDMIEIPKVVDFANANGVPYFLLGSGTNVLFHDNGFRGVVIKINGQKISIHENKIMADAGATIAKLVQRSLETGLSGLEPWIGLPGRVGGAVYGNAGCDGLETKDVLKKATLFDPNKRQIREEKNSYFKFGYRDSILKKNSEIVLNATFKLKKSKITPEEQKELMTKIRSARVQKQPFGLSSGSFFKNPSDKQPAGLLIEQAGLKGHTIGNAQISEKHANFLINLGNATSQEIKALASLAEQKVKEKFGITLEEEVQIVPEK